MVTVCIIVAVLLVFVALIAEVVRREDRNQQLLGENFDLSIKLETATRLLANARKINEAQAKVLAKRGNGPTLTLVEPADDTEWDRLIDAVTPKAAKQVRP